MSYQAIDSSKAIICEGLSKWIDFEKLANKIVEVVSLVEVPLLQEIDESKALFFYKSEQEVMEVPRIGSLKVALNIIFFKRWFRIVNTINPKKTSIGGCQQVSK